MQDDLLTRQLHSRYASLTGLDVELDMPKIYAWDNWMAKGWGQAELEEVVNHLRRTIQPKQRLLRYFNFHNLVERTDYFESNLKEARALSRVKRFDPGKREVLKATNRPSTPEHPKEKTPAQIMRESEALKKLLEVRDSL